MNLKLFHIVITLLVILGSCKTVNNTSTKKTFDFQSDLDGQVTETMPGILVSVVKKDGNGFNYWNGASGLSDVENNVKLFPNQTFRIASITKTFVAATILRLYEDGKLKLDDHISMYISEEHFEILKHGNYNPNEITIYHLLTHSSGLADHTHSPKYEFDFLKLNHVWTRTEQLNDLVNFMKPVGEIGEKFSYSDSGYILLGEIIEAITKKTLGEAIVEQLKLKKLSLTSIYMEDFDNDSTNKRIHQYFDGNDTYFINPTFDYYGGGGLLSNTYDLCLFVQYLFENKIFNNPATLKKMLTPVNFNTKQSLDYRIGIWETDVCGMSAYTHTGFWGTQVIYIPRINTSIAVNYSQRWNNKGIAPVIPIIVEKIVAMKSLQ